MRKLVHHKNILQLLDWNTTEGERPEYTDCYSSARMKPLFCSPMKDNEALCKSPVLSLFAEPYILIMEFVSYGTLRTFLQTHRTHLSADPELQGLLTIASYHIALAMQHLRSKMVKT